MVTEPGALVRTKFIRSYLIPVIAKLKQSYLSLVNEFLFSRTSRGGTFGHGRGGGEGGGVGKSMINHNCNIQNIIKSNITLLNKTLFV